MHNSGPKRILVVDDEKSIADSVALILCSSGYDATARNDAQSALQECEVRIPDLVVSDVIMPGMNGIEMAIQIRQQYPACRILLISGLGSSFGLAEEAAQRGHEFEILSKPIRPLELLAKIASTLTEGKAPQADEEHLATGEHLAVRSNERPTEISYRKTGT